MRVTRRRFLQIVAASTAALGLSQTQLVQLAERVLSREGRPRVIWIQGQNCTGCTLAFANLEWDGAPEWPTPPGAGNMGEVAAVLADPVNGIPPWKGQTPAQVLGGVLQPDNKTTIDDVLLDIIDLDYLQTIMATGGEGAHNILTAARASGGFSSGILIVEGAIPTNDNKYCTIANSSAGTPATELFVGNVVADIANTAIGNAAAVLSVGTCASFGGVPAANTDPAPPKTGAKGVEDYLKGLVGTYAPVVNVPGCPIHPDWLFGTLVHQILGDLLSNLDAYGRPKFYFGSPVHGGRCSHYQDYCDGEFATEPGDAGCLAMLGCKGFSTYADCVFGGPASTPGRGWNVFSRDANGNPTSGNSCINNGYPCMGCTEKAYPDRFSPFFRY